MNASGSEAFYGSQRLNKQEIARKVFNGMSDMSKLETVKPSEEYLKAVRPLWSKVAIKTEADFLSWIDLVAQLGVRAKSNDELGWVYRGQRNAEWEIKSSFERIYGCSGLEIDLRSIERKRLKDFQYAYGFSQGEKLRLDYLGWTALMQHYGVATRLIDFTESPLVALFMATQELLSGKYDSNGQENCFSVWAFYRGVYANVYNSRSPGFWDSRHCERSLCRCDDFDQYLKRQEHTLENVLNGVAANVTCANCMLSGQDAECAERNINYPKVLWIKPGIGNDRLWAQAGLFLMPLSLRKTTMQQLFWHPYTRTDGKSEAKEFMDAECINIGNPNIKIEYLRAIEFKFSVGLLPYAKKILKMANVRASLLFPDFEGVAQEFRAEI